MKIFFLIAAIIILLLLWSIKIVYEIKLNNFEFSASVKLKIPFDKELKNGVKDLVFDLEAKTVTVTYDANKTDVPSIQKAFAKIGKPATTEAPKSHHQCEGHHHHHGEGEHHHH